jgi:hypothetical protein
MRFIFDSELKAVVRSAGLLAPQTPFMRSAVQSAIEGGVPPIQGRYITGLRKR